jgi:Na+-driven multidrug efflux pump
VYKRALIVGSGLTVIGFLVAYLFPGAIVSIFTTDAELLAISKKAMQIIFFSFPIVGFQVVTTNFFQSIGKAKLAILLSLSRQLIFLLPALLILPPLFGVDGVWMALPTGDLLASLVTLMVILWQRKKLFPAE